MAVADNSGDVVELFRPRQGGADELGDACNVLGLSHRRWQAMRPFFGIYDGSKLELTDR